ncbi:3145_t:CDS:1, partial [Racocetra persica]
INKIEEQNEAETYHIEEGEQDDDLLFYNSWTDIVSDKNPA